MDMCEYEWWHHICQLFPKRYGVLVTSGVQRKYKRHKKGPAEYKMFETRMEAKCQLWIHCLRRKHVTRLVPRGRQLAQLSREAKRKGPVSVTEDVGGSQMLSKGLGGHGQDL